MNQQKNQGEEASPLLRDLQAEVSSESAPLLQFILQNAGLIAGVVILFLLVLVGTALWNWYDDSRNAEARDTLAKVNMTLQGQERLTALEKLATEVPDDVKVAVYMSLGESALAEGNAAVAAKAYAAAAREDADGALGLVAALGEAGSLFKAGKDAEALKILQAVEASLPEEQRTQALRQMVAEAAVRAGQKDVAAKAYAALAKKVQGAEKAYFMQRAEELGYVDSPAAQ